MSDVTGKLTFPDPVIIARSVADVTAAKKSPLAQDGPAGQGCGENDKRCRNCSTGVFALSQTRKAVIRAFGTKQNDPPLQACGDQVRAQTLNATTP